MDLARLLADLPAAPNIEDRRNDPWRYLHQLGAFFGDQNRTSTLQPPMHNPLGILAGLNDITAAAPPPAPQGLLGPILSDDARRRWR